MRTQEVAGAPAAGSKQAGRRLLFWGCFISLIATSFGFVIRGFIIGDLQAEFGLSETQKGVILGVGLWPFAISIVLFSLVIDKIGYGKAMIFAFVCHVVSAVLMIFVRGYTALYIGTFIVALANGTVEAVINPVVATLYPKHKTKMLTILHAGWPGGIVLGGILTLLMGGAGWQAKVALILIPTAVYGIILLKCKFPVSERVAAGVPYKDMLKEAGAIGWLIVVYMIMMAINDAFKLDTIPVGSYFSLPVWWLTIVMGVLTAAYLVYTRSLGRPMYVFLLLIMILLAITELGTDTWMKELRDPAMRKIGLDAGWILIYTASIMVVLRFCIGPIVKALRPLGVLLGGSLFAAAGLYFLAGAEGVWIILIAATIYGVGQTFFWPVTLGLVAERFPRGGALTLNAIAGVGMLGVGIIGAPLMGYLQDTRIDDKLQAHAGMRKKLVDPKEKTSVLGKYRSLDANEVNRIEYKIRLYDYRKDFAERMAAAPTAQELNEALAADEPYQALVLKAYNLVVREGGERGVKSHGEMLKALEAKGIFVGEQGYRSLVADKELLDGITTDAKKNAMATIAILPLIMAACYLGLIFYFAARGGYKAIDLTAEGEPAGERAVTAQEAIDDEEATPSE